MSSLLRSTKLVRYFAGAARTLILNSAKTAEANLLINSKAICVANNVLMRDYATSKKTESLEPLLQRLDNEVRRFGRISKRDIDEVFDEIRGKHDITSSQSLLVIRCCGDLVPEELPEQRTLLVQKIWSVLTERGVPMDISHYNALLRVYIENEHPFSPAEFLNELEQKGLQPNRVTYQRLMWRYCQEGDVEGATKVLEKMRELSLPVSEPVLNALVMGHAFHGDTEGARAVLETMAGAGLQPSNRTYALLACGHARKGDIQGVEAVLQTAKDKDVVIDDKDVLDIIEALAVGGHGDKVEHMYEHLQKGYGFVQELCSLILRLINKGHVEVAKAVMKAMPGVQESDKHLYTGAFFVKQLMKVQKTPENVIKVCRELQDDGTIPNALFIATEAALAQGSTEIALLLFKELEKNGTEIRQHFYWPLLVQKGKENDEEGLIHLLREMSQQGMAPSGETLRDYVLPYMLNKDTPQNVVVKLQIANISHIHSSRNIMSQLLDMGKIKEAAEVALIYKPFGQYNLLVRPLTNAVGKTKDIKSFVDILHVISSKPLVIEEDSNPDEDARPADGKNDAHQIGRIVINAIKNLSADLYEELLTEVHSRGLRISTESAEGIQQYLGQKLTSGISERLAQLTSSEQELTPLSSVRRGARSLPVTPERRSADLERLIAQNKGGNAARYQKQLLSLYVQENEVEKLNNFLKNLESENFELTNSTIAQLVEFYALNGDLEKALELKKRLDACDPQFMLNTYKLVVIANAFVKANRFEDAVAFLMENNPETKDGSSFSVNSKCWQILNSLAEKKEAEKVKELTKVLINRGYIEPSNVLLGPSIKVHLLRDDVDSALQEFEQASKQYRCTPWKGELMKALILKEDASKLQWLADLSTQIHGEVNILHDLVLAFVECGRLRQARRILETPGLQARSRRLRDACERYVQEGKPEYLEGLLEATKELNHIDRSNIYYHLLQSYCKADQTDKALGLWTLLQEEGEVPSEDFLKYLANHLKQNNRDIPFAIPNEPAKPKKEKKQNNADNDALVTKKNVTKAIETSVQAGNLNEAVDQALASLKVGVLPKPTVLKYLLKSLALEGEVNEIEKIGFFLNENARRNVTYDDKRTLAVFTKGDGAAHVDALLQKVTQANTEEELSDALKQFPRSNALQCVVKNSELLEKCHKIAELAATKGNYLPANLLWMEYILTGKDKEADALWNNYLIKAESIAYRRLMQESHLNNSPQQVDRLISCLKTNKNITSAVLGNAYSRLINLHLSHGNTEDAKGSLQKAMSEGINIDHINVTTLKKLKSAQEAIGQEFKYNIKSESS
ncbi:leucine-rich PPR motif-containing protein, mitochondrial [Plutella xylostella]|uniref:leucine-rich PPR motif-containing protein, mitochondrial n=1 Tax=Plutella xylostella TaxID=51655 RepID=UPI002032DB80|nr:leucine-rich PPR motif-containing protein, mitochondrial [Plutella xylostella]